MEILSYHKKAKKTAFTFACEIFMLSSERINCTKYKNHSFSAIELFFQICNNSMENPKSINFGKLYNNSNSLMYIKEHLLPFNIFNKHLHSIQKIVFDYLIKYSLL